MLCVLPCSAQNRVDTAPAELQSKSKTIKKATYWEQVDGKWKSRKANKLVYEGEGVACDNFEAMFIGEFAGRTFLFVDKHDYFWRYPTLQTEWWQARTMHEALLSDEDYSALKNIEPGQSIVVTTGFAFSMSKAHDEYSFPFFISMGETMLSADEAQHKESDKVPFLVAKRVDSDKGDVVRFRLGAVTELIDSFYFEVPYSEWSGLFVSDSNVSYK